MLVGGGCWWADWVWKVEERWLSPWMFMRAAEKEALASVPGTWFVGVMYDVRCWLEAYRGAPGSKPGA